MNKYTDESPATPNAAAPDTQDTDESGNQSGETALLPKSVLGNTPCKVGDTITFRVVAEHEKEIEVAKEDSESSSEDANEGGEPAAPEAPMGGPPGYQ